MNKIRSQTCGRYWASIQKEFFVKVVLHHHTSTLDGALVQIIVYVLLVHFKCGFSKLYIDSAFSEYFGILLLTLNASIT
ncbi:unnamed protein product [Allacma fusca]|uniref:Uncharacterized protein n=1 Tax=Allacma fusca TaxID=39272 RepID=A0A8J2LPQ8_9HEXA|nr:unnamed protein product [Allacma fusca]